MLLMSFFSVFDSKGEKFEEKSKPKYIKYQNHSFNFFQNVFKRLFMLFLIKI
jgi:hypothetical protein